MYRGLLAWRQYANLQTWDVDVNVLESYVRDVCILSKTDKASVYLTLLSLSLYKAKVLDSVAITVEVTSKWVLLSTKWSPVCSVLSA